MTSGYDTFNDFIQADVDKAGKLLNDRHTHFGCNFDFFLTPLKQNNGWKKIKYVIRQEYFDQDFMILGEKLGLKSWKKTTKEWKYIGEKEKEKRVDEKYHHLEKDSIEKLYFILKKDYDIINFLVEKNIIERSYMSNFI